MVTANRQKPDFAARLDNKDAAKRAFAISAVPLKVCAGLRAGCGFELPTEVYGVAVASGGRRGEIANVRVGGAPGLGMGMLTYTVLPGRYALVASVTATPLPPVVRADISVD